MQVTFNITRGHTIALFKVITLGLLLGFGIQFLFAWTAPTAVAPSGNVDGPLTVGAANQIKTGGLNLGALTVVGGASIGTALGLDNLCLNGTCITAWPTGGDNLGNHTATMNINMAGRQVTNLGATTNPTDAATKAYVDALIAAANASIAANVAALNASIAANSVKQGSMCGLAAYPNDPQEILCNGVQVNKGCPAGYSNVFVPNVNGDVRTCMKN